MDRHLIVRADAGRDIGTGHLMRCLALAQGWREQNGEVTFISRCENESLRRRVEDSGSHFVALEETHPAPADLMTTRSVLQQSSGAWLVLDGYHFDSSYQKAVRRAGYRVMVIDDLAHWPCYDADVLLNQNINARQLDYSCNPDCRLLLGTEYALIRSEFRARAGQPGEVLETARRVLVTMGGSDSDNVTLKVVQALRQMELPGLEARIVVGAANPNIDTLQEAARDSSGSLAILTDAHNIAELMAWADVAVSGGGSTVWELAYMGLPSLVVVLADNQLHNTRALAELGAVMDLGWGNDIDASALATALHDVLTRRELRADLRRKGRDLVDGLGRRRVVELLAEETSAL